MSKQFILMRGCTGSGKSYKSHQLAGSFGRIFSADNFFLVGQEYKFDANKLPEAHKQCQEKTMEALINNEEIVIVDNTNTTLKELKSYKEHIIFALKNDYEVKIEEAGTEWQFDLDELVKRNIHNVPREVIEKMLKRYQKNITVEDILKDKKLW